MGFTKNERPQSQLMAKNKLTLFIILGISFGIIDIVLMVVDPILICAKLFIRVDNGTYTHRALTTEIDCVHISVYLFNITNAERFQQGLDYKLKVEEVGPFTYQDMRLNENFEIDHKTNSVRFSPRIIPKFLASESVGRPEDVNVTMPNLAMLSVASKVGSYSLIPRMGFNLLTNRLQTKSIVNVRAQDYLWGYEEPLIKLGNTVMPGLVTFDVMGILDRLYDKKKKFIFEMSTKNEDRFSLRSVNGCPGLEAWHYKDPTKRSKCNSFVNTYEGIGYPVNMDGSEPLRLYRTVFCRILDMEYKGKKMTSYDFEGLEYVMSKRNFDINNDTECLCSEGTCMEGVSDLSPCFIGLPVVLSNAHYLYADPKLYERIEGIKPDEKRHGSSIVIEPKIGLAVNTKFSVQMSLVVKDVNFNSETSRFSDMIIPIIYFKIEQPPLVPKSQYHIKLMYNIGPKLILGLQIILGVLSLVFLAYAARTLYWYRIYQPHGIVLQTERPVDSKEPLMEM